MGARPPFNGTLGTDDRPTVIETELIELLTTDARSLVGVAEGATSTDGTVIYPSGSSPQGAPTDLAVQVDGTSRPVTGMEYVDGTGTTRPVTQWHLGPLGEFTLTLDSLTFVEPATFDVFVASTTSPVKPGNTLDVTADVTNTGDESGTQTVTLSIDNSVGQVDSTNVTLSGGGSVTKTLSWAVPSGQTEQDYTATVASDDDSASQTVTVNSVTVVDDFEDGNVAEWTIGDDGGGSSVTATNAAAKVGSFGMEIYRDVGGGGTPDMSSYPGDGLPHYPQNGDTIEWWIRQENPAGEPVALLQIKSEGAGENIDCRLTANASGRDEISVSHYDGSQTTASAGTNPGLSHPAWYKYSVDFVDSNVELRVEDSSGTNVATLNISPSISQRSDWGMFGSMFTGTSGAGDVITYIDEIVRV